MDKIIFLDFDGVITCVNSNWRFSKTLCDRVQKIVDETSSKVVVTSSWRLRNVDDTIKFISESRMFLLDELPRFLNKPTFIDVTIKSDELLTKGSGLIIPRGVEVMDWLMKHYGVMYDSSEVNYIILDDDNDFLMDQSNHFIRTNPIIGISEIDVSNSIRLLNQVSHG